jgi:hypothetical protein
MSTPLQQTTNRVLNAHAEGKFVAVMTLVKNKALGDPTKTDVENIRQYCETVHMTDEDITYWTEWYGLNRDRL